MKYNGVTVKLSFKDDICSYSFIFDQVLYSRKVNCDSIEEVVSGIKALIDDLLDKRKMCL